MTMKTELKIGLAIWPLAVPAALLIVMPVQSWTRFLVDFLAYCLFLTVAVFTCVYFALAGPRPVLFKKEDWLDPANQFHPSGYDKAKYNVLLDTHFHTRHSDGIMTVEEGIAWHLAMGFNAFLQISTHGYVFTKASAFVKIADAIKDLRLGARKSSNKLFYVSKNNAKALAISGLKHGDGKALSTWVDTANRQIIDFFKKYENVAFDSLVGIMFGKGFPAKPAFSTKDGMFSDRHASAYQAVIYIFENSLVGLVGRETARKIMKEPSIKALRSEIMLMVRNAIDSEWYFKADGNVVNKGRGIARQTSFSDFTKS
ncbi:MAG: hypothetical protein Q6353_015760, partial [Candidatus Sigynarchaeum springense]